MKENTNQFIQNDKVLCNLTSGNSTTGEFTVKTVAEKAVGILKVDRKEPRMQELTSTVRLKKTILLYVDRINDEGKIVFSLTPIESVETVCEAVPVNFSFTSSNAEYNQKVFDALLGTLDIIDSDEKFEMVKHLFDVNRACKFMPNLAVDLFFKCQPRYQRQLWAEGYFMHISNYGVKKLWKESNDEEKSLILRRLGIEWPKPEPEIITNEVVKEIEVVKEVPMSTLTTFFDSIEDEVLRNIESATDSIHVAMAWFTNFYIFKALKDALARGVKVILITNNDLINNGGYCLNFNELIDAGMELHIAEFPAKMMHHKFCIVDGSMVMNGSYNWTFPAEVYNLENMIVIKDAQEVIEQFESTFAQLLEQFPAVDRMPDTVPEKPEYDRSSFKQYISEELVARSKRGIGDVRENVRKACRLSPAYQKVQQVVIEQGLENDHECIESMKAYEKVCQPIKTTTHFEKIEKELMDKLCSAQKSVKFAVSWILSQNLVEKLKELAAKGISVEVVTNNDLINNGECSCLKELVDAKITLHLAEPTQKQVHHKFCIIDEKTLINGSYDWTTCSSSNEENIMIVENDTDAVTCFGQEFDRLKQSCHRVQSAPAPLNSDSPENDRSAYRQYVTAELNERASQATNQTDRIESLQKAASINKPYLTRINPNYETTIKLANDARNTTATIAQKTSITVPASVATPQKMVSGISSPTPQQSGRTSSAAYSQPVTVVSSPSYAAPHSIPQPVTSASGPKIQDAKTEENVHNQIIEKTGVSTFFMGVDVSGSMDGFFRCGLARQVIQQAIVCAAAIAENPSVSVWTYENKAHFIGDYGINNAASIPNQTPNGGTELQSFVSAIKDNVNKSLVFIFTDGDDFNPEKVASLMRQKPDTYWQILGCGTNFSKIANAISSLSNASLVQCDNIGTKSPDEIKQMILGNYLAWKNAQN